VKYFIRYCYWYGIMWMKTTLFCLRLHPSSKLRTHKPICIQAFNINACHASASPE
jgi:hypothetical protein